jgi:hypothetical protein
MSVTVLENGIVRLVLTEVPSRVNLTITPPQPVALQLTAGQGPAGTNGTDGVDGGSYEHHQPVASTLWVVNHNLGYYPSISVLTLGRVRVDAGIVHLSPNQAQVLLDLPLAGFAICS